MSSSIWPQTVADVLDALGPNPTANEVYDALLNFDTRYAAAAIGATAIAGGGGGGGNVPFVGDDPPPDPTDGMLWWDPDDDTPVPAGSVPGITRVTVPIAFNTPGLTFPDGPLDIYAPDDGEWILGWGISVPTTAWDGTTPTLTIGPPGDLGHYLNTSLAGTDQATGSGDTTLPQSLGGSDDPWGGAEILHSDPIQALVDDGAGGAPGSTEGAGEIVLLILAAP